MTESEDRNAVSTSFAKDEETKSSGAITFDPPVYVQRYKKVASILDNETFKNHISKVVDFGCAECKFFKYMKRLTHVTYFCAVDLDEELIRRARYEAQPFPGEYIIGISRQLTVDLFTGSIAEVDYRLLDMDAVVGIEIIEHLYPDVLNKVPETVFRYIQPKVAIFTTPNADFNVLFDLKKFRHDDHKFEWTRKEFEDWANAIVEKYVDYEVYFEGIGPGPVGTETLGCCSQMAVFSRKTASKNPICNFNQKPYQLFETYVYPYTADDRTDEQKLHHEISYRINSMMMSSLYDITQREDMRYEIPVDYLFKYTRDVCPTKEVLIEKLARIGYDIETKDDVSVLLYNEDYETSDSEQFDLEEDYDSTVITDTIEEDWD